MGQCSTYSCRFYAVVVPVMGCSDARFASQLEQHVRDRDLDLVKDVSMCGHVFFVTEAAGMCVAAPFRNFVTGVLCYCVLSRTVSGLAFPWLWTFCMHPP